MNFEYFKRIPLKKYTQIHLFKNSGYFLLFHTPTPDARRSDTRGIP